MMVVLAVGLILADSAFAGSGAGYKRYWLALSVKGNGAASRTQTGPLPDGNGIDTAQGTVTSRFRSTTRLAIAINPRTRRVKFPYSRPGFASEDFGNIGDAFLGGGSGGACCVEIDGQWSGVVGDTPDRTGDYTCSFSRRSEGGVFPKSFVTWTYAGRPKAGKVPVSFAINQEPLSEQQNPHVSCSGFPVDHGYPGNDTIHVGVFMTLLTNPFPRLTAPNLTLIPVKPLLANLRKHSHPAVTVPGFDHGLGDCGGCPLPMSDGDVSTFDWKLEAKLFRR